MPMIKYQINGVRSKITSSKTHRVSDSLENTAYVIFCYGEPRLCRPQSVPRTPRPREIPPSEVTRARREEGGEPRGTVTAKAVNDGERCDGIASPLCMMSLRIRSNLETSRWRVLRARRERLAVRSMHDRVRTHVYGALLSPFGEPHQCHREHG